MFNKNILVLIDIGIYSIMFIGIVIATLILCFMVDNGYKLMVLLGISSVCNMYVILANNSYM